MPWHSAVTFHDQNLISHVKVNWHIDDRLIFKGQTSLMQVPHLSDHSALHFQSVIAGSRLSVQENPMVECASSVCRTQPIGLAIMEFGMCLDCTQHKAI